MIFTRFGIRFFIITGMLIVGCYLYTIYRAISYTGVMTLPTGKRYIVHPDLLVASGLGKGDIGKTATQGHYALINIGHQTAIEADLHDTDLVIGITVDGLACAYAYSVLLKHQVINELLGSHALCIAVCPFTDTITCFNAVVQGDVIQFGVSGMLYLGSLVLYDRVTHSSWSALEGRALIGPMSGYSLAPLPVMVTTWKQWQSLYPETLVVCDSDDTSDYTDPYCKLYVHPEHNLYGTSFVDYRLSPQTPIVGLVIDGESVAYSVEKICDRGFMQDNVGNTPVLITACGLPCEVGTYPLAIFDRRVDGSELYFAYIEDKLTDTKTQSLWNERGHAYEGPLAGTALKRLPIVCTRWFTWSLFYPNTRIMY
jgi:hypothetical protein